MLFFIVVLLLLLVFFFYVNNKDWAAPSVLFVSAFVVSAFVFILNSFVFNFELADKTIYLIITGVAVFCLGSLFGGKQNNYKEERGFTLYRVPKSIIWRLALFSLFLPFLRILDIYTVTGSLNVFGGLGEYRAREITTIWGTILKIIGPICNAINIVMILVIISNRLSHFTNKWHYYIPVISYFFSSALSSARIEIIYMFLYAIIAFLMLHLIITGASLKFRHYKNLMAALLFLGVMFFGLGFMTGKSQKNEISGVDYVSIYAASSFAALDDYLDGFKYDSKNFGSETLFGLTNLFSWVGIDKRYVENRDNESMQFGSYSTNVYSCFRPLLHDFNYFGMYLVLFFEGMLFGFFYRKAINGYRRGRLFWVAFYMYSCGYLMLSPVAERLFACLFTMTTLMFLLSLVYLERKCIVKVKIQ